MKGEADRPVAALKGGPVWLITFSTYRRRPVFDNPDLRGACAEAFRETCERNGYRVAALAIMPDHVHLVLDAGDSGHSVSKALNNVKGVSARRVFQASPEVRLDLHSDHLWTTGFHSGELAGLAAVARACRYVEENPIELGYPRQHHDWILRVTAPR